MRIWRGAERGRLLTGAMALLLTLHPTAARTESAAPLKAQDVASLLAAAATSLSDATLAVAVVDRTGAILGVVARTNDSAIEDRAVALARTGAFFSNDRAPLSSRTVRFISGIHFPPGVANTPNAALYGIENSNRGCQLDAAGDAVFNQPLVSPRSIEGTFGSGAAGAPNPPPCRPSDTRGCSPGIVTGKPDIHDNAGLPLDVPVDPGGLPLYRGGRVVGGIGVAGVEPARAEYAAARGATSVPGITTAIAFPDPLPPPGAIFIDGIRLPFFGSCTTVACVQSAVAQPPAGASGGSSAGVSTIVAPRDGSVDPEGFLIGPFASAVDGGLTLTEVQTLVNHGVATADRTRAQIRLPAGETTRMIIAVSDQTGRVLAAYRMPDATFFSLDVAATKARNAYYFSTREGYDVLRRYVDESPSARYRWEPDPPPGSGWAMTNRSLNYGAQPLFPPGIDLDRTPTAGPWFDLFAYDTQNPCTEGPGATRGGDRTYANQSGIVWFAGSAPLFRNGRLVGGIGVSGDGVDQDDYVTAAAAAGFEPPAALRADQSEIVRPDGTRSRLPYAKFPRNPEVR
jgi:uncharacterized protein GlcG (DUF336 family)